MLALALLSLLAPTIEPAFAWTLTEAGPALSTRPAPRAVPADTEQAIWLIEVGRLPATALRGWVTSGDAPTRARTALALGRLRDPAGIADLAALAADADPDVRATAAFGLGLVPGGAPALHERLKTEEDTLVRARLIQALGLQPQAADIPIFQAALDASAAEGREAAVALGRLAIAKVELPSAAVEALALQLERWDPERRRAAAFALARVAPRNLSPELLQELSRRATSDHDPAVRAFVVRALGRIADAATLAEAARDPDRGVRTAVARALGQRGEADPELVKGLLADRAWEVRLEAIGACGSIPLLDHSALLKPFLTQEPVLAAAAVSALDHAGVSLELRDYLKEDQPLPVRIAAIGSLDDQEQLLRLATKSPEAPIRTAAASRLDELKAGSEVGLALLASADPIIAATGIAMLDEDPRWLDKIIARCTNVQDVDLLSAALDALESGLPKLPPKAPPPAGAKDLVSRGLQHPSAAVRAKAQPPAKRLGLPIPAPIHLVPELPSLAEVRKVLSARVVTDAGELRIILRPDLAPYTVWNFVRLAENGFFDGHAFHRVVPDFVIQDGCPRGDGNGGPGYTIPDELSWLPYGEGAVGMALSGPDTGGSQWFATLSPQPHLEAGYTVFGQLVDSGGQAQSIRVGTVIKDVVIERSP